MIDWNKAFEWANYAAMDEDGQWWFFSDEPRLKPSYWGQGNGEGEKVPPSLSPTYDGDWQASLRERPKTSEGLTVGMLKELLKDINDDCLVLITNKEFDGNGMIAAYEPGCMTPATDQGAVILRGTWK